MFNMNNLKQHSNIVSRKYNSLVQRRFVDPTKYRQTIGNSLYFVICTKPDILLSSVKSTGNSEILITKIE
jgi:hypothetical protein